MPQSIEESEGSVQETVETWLRVRSLLIELEDGRDGTIIFRRERLKKVNGVVVRGFGADPIIRNVESALAETVTHGGQPVSLQTTFAILKKFHDKWKAEDEG